MAAIEEYFGEDCPRCLTWAGEGVEACEGCGYAIPLALVLPYDDPPWEYTESLMQRLDGYEALRLMARYAGRSPERIGELERCRRLYLSRYKGFRFEALRTLRGLEDLELDYASITDVDGMRDLRLSILKLTECRRLGRLDGLAGCATVKLLSLALCNAVKDHSPIGALAGLQSLFIEAREVVSLDFVRGMHDLRSITLGVDRIATGGLQPLFDVSGLREIVLRKNLVKPKVMLPRLRERFPDAEIVID
jgi:hypothetical protein